MDRLSRERSFHDELSTKSRLPIFKGAYSIFEASQRDYFELIRGEGLSGARVLELGCGRCVLSRKLAKDGAKVDGIDISPGNVELSRKVLREAGLDQQICLQVMNAEALTFPAGSFDVVCGSGILHHLDLEKVSAEIRRVLKPGGRAVFIEPLGHNPVITLFRRLTPKARTADEHPLLMGDLDYLAARIGPSTRRFHHLAGLLAIPFARTPLGSPLRRWTLALDRKLLATGLLQPLAWVVVLGFVKPLDP